MNRRLADLPAFVVVVGPYVVAINLLLADFLHQVVDLILGGDQVVRQDLLVESARVLDDQGHKATDIPQVRECGGHVPIADDFIVARRHGVVDTTGGEARVGELVPPTHIDEGVGQPDLADLVVNNFFLSERVSFRRESCGGGILSSYLVAQPHHTTGRCRGDETTGNKPLHVHLLRGLGEGDLVLLLRGADAADDDIDAVQRFDELLLGRLQVTFANFDPSFLQSQNGGFVGGRGADETDDFLQACAIRGRN